MEDAKKFRTSSRISMISETRLPATIYIIYKTISYKYCHDNFSPSRPIEGLFFADICMNLVIIIHYDAVKTEWCNPTSVIRCDAILIWKQAATQCITSISIK
jgi:hypothetical protein